MARPARAAARAPQASPGREREDKYFSKVIGKALDLIDILRASPQPLSLNELTLQLELTKSSVFRILHTLEVSGYIQRDSLGRYTAAEDLQASAPGQLRAALVDAAMPCLKELSREFQETVSLAMRFENRVEVVGTIESPHLIRMGNTVGRIVPPHASSLGKAVAAFQPEEMRERLVRSYGIHRFTEHTVTDEVALKAAFEQVRARGYSTDEEESVLDGRCFGVPVLDGGGRAIAAMSISAPKSRIRDERLQKRILTALQRAASRVSTALAPRSRA
ncbi:MAG TPA: IclR family transcriptional regulator [Vicinamibacterales bacterium]|jgi:IclR family acetate operon transcriptional repressor|nr:IclR family transcriptional regulator [Vicinamibacterales bacterium]